MTPKKSRRSGSETLEYLRDEFQSESQYKKQELALRVKEQESRDAQELFSPMPWNVLCQHIIQRVS